MGLISRSYERFVALCKARGVDPALPVAVRPLNPDDAIGANADPQLAIKKGKERVIEATFCDARGQAFTDQPTSYQGALKDVLSLDLELTPNRAIFVATLNAVLRFLGVAAGTVHCKDDAPTRCGPEVAQAVAARFGRARLALIGLQPALLGGLVRQFGPEMVCALDLNPDNVGTTVHGVPIWDGVMDLGRAAAWCDVGIATGSSVVNGTADGILDLFGDAGKPLIFFGNTIAGVAALLELDRICPFGR